jgi:uncharacterized protein YcfL
MRKFLLVLVLLLCAGCVQPGAVKVEPKKPIVELQMPENQSTTGAVVLNVLTGSAGAVVALVALVIILGTRKQIRRARRRAAARRRLSRGVKP